ncbi:MAG: flagellar export chaperone FliS [Pseudomonadales bacterium]|nr:flagellar export chaperone FliS [Pseudomonadales bacterium]
MELSRQVEQASPHELIMLLFDGLLDCLGKSKISIVEEENKMLGVHLDSARAILAGLRESLDIDQGGSLAENLDSLYSYMSRCLEEAGNSCDISRIAEVIDLIKTLKEAWRAIEPDCAQIAYAESLP